MMREQMRVTFDPLRNEETPDADITPRFTREERKLLWYSREELMNSCLEAKKIVQVINSVNGNYNAIDHTQVCVVGLEKFHGKQEREKYRKLLVKAVLIRQEMNRGLGDKGADCLCDISKMISSSFKDFALWQAAMHKCHARTPDGSSRASSQDTANEFPSKRRRVEGGLSRQPKTTTLSHAPTSENPDPIHVRQEIHQLMVGFCT